MTFYPVGQFDEYTKVCLESNLRGEELQFKEYNGTIGIELPEGTQGILDYVFLLDPSTIVLTNQGESFIPKATWTRDMWELLLAKYVLNPYKITIPIDIAMTLDPNVLVVPIDMEIEEGILSPQELSARGEIGCELIIDDQFFIVGERGLYCNLKGIPGVHSVSSVLSSLLIKILQELFDTGYVRVPNGYNNQLWNVSVIKAGDNSYAYCDWVSPLVQRNSYLTEQIVDFGFLCIPLRTGMDLRSWTHLSIDNIKVLYSIDSRYKLLQLEQVGTERP